MPLIRTSPREPLSKININLARNNQILLEWPSSSYKVNAKRREWHPAGTIHIRWEKSFTEWAQLQCQAKAVKRLYIFSLGIVLPRNITLIVFMSITVGALYSSRHVLRISEECWHKAPKSTNIKRYIWFRKCCNPWRSRTYPQSNFSIAIATKFRPYQEHISIATKPISEHHITKTRSTSNV